ncbi:hypothetical protein [Sinomonas sp. P47F7]|uniref:hypothetical protein n=1 Tax=Sinomonas sp. P47F7 TaxID=3410987 RepID=UPI003BF5C012
MLFLRYSWVLAAPAAFGATAVCLGVFYGAWGVVPLAWGALLHASVGLLGSYVAHECGHFAALSLCRGVTTVKVEATLLRTSLKPEGEITARESLVLALAGPLGCLILGAAAWAAVPQSGVAWWYLAHLALLAPCFGDGRAVVAAVRRISARTSPGLQPRGPSR